MRQDEQTLSIEMTQSGAAGTSKDGLNWGNAAPPPIVALDTPSPEELSALLKATSDVELRQMTAKVATQMLGGALFLILTLTFGIGVAEVALVSQGVLKPEHRLITPSVLCVLVATPVAAVAAVIRQLGRYAFAVENEASKESLVSRMVSAMQRKPSQKTEREVH